MDEMKKAIAIHNAVGLTQIGYSMEEALEIALDAEDNLFPETMKRLKIPRTGYGSMSGRAGGGGSATGPGGSHGGAT